MKMKNEDNVVDCAETTAAMIIWYRYASATAAAKSAHRRRHRRRSERGEDEVFVLAASSGV
jgi:hypothetical protein